MTTLNYTTNSEEETIDLGLKFASKLKAGDVVALYGDLGSGKTEFVKGICNFFKVDDIVNSPTFTIINQYTGFKGGEDIPIFHIDLYRIKTQKELDEIGFKECLFSDDSIKLLEWADKAVNELPLKKYSVRIKLNSKKENERIFEIN